MCIVITSNISSFVCDAAPRLKTKAGADVLSKIHASRASNATGSKNRLSAVRSPPEAARAAAGQQLELGGCKAKKVRISNIT